MIQFLIKQIVFSAITVSSFYMLASYSKLMSAVPLLIYGGYLFIKAEKGIRKASQIVNDRFAAKMEELNTKLKSLANISDPETTKKEAEEALRILSEAERMENNRCAIANKNDIRSYLNNIIDECAHPA